MESLDLKTNSKKIELKRDGVVTGVISFDPSDVVFAEKFYNLIAEFQAKSKEYEPRAQALDENTATDTHGLPVNLGERIALLRGVCEYIRDRIDHLFGIGTSQAAFGEVYDTELIVQFLEGLKPFFQKARSEKIKKYTSPASEKRNKRK
mgnify:FL=1